MEIYRLATDQPYSLLYVKLNEKNKNNIFYVNYGKKITIEDA